MILAQNGALGTIHESMTENRGRERGLPPQLVVSLQRQTPGNQYPSGMCWNSTAHDGIIPENLERESQE